METSDISDIGSFVTLDEESHTVFVHVGRVSIALEIEEFLDFSRHIVGIRDILMRR